MNRLNGPGKGAILGKQAGLVFEKERLIVVVDVTALKRLGTRWPETTQFCVTWNVLEPF